ncbi:transposase [Ectobacillus antri]|jgi:putative transposase|uniref:transposase n=1 Tax=Ectobacillus antri TaxID=2486280 RepID=UPI001FE383E7|nr:transposase [Ectobacillus antri]
MTTITAKIQIYTSDNQFESLKVTTNAYRKACNWLSKHIFKTKNLNQANINSLYYADLRNQFALKSQMAQSVMKTVIARYKSAKSNGHDWSLIDFKGVPSHAHQANNVNDYIRNDPCFKTSE